MKKSFSNTKRTSKGPISRVKGGSSPARPHFAKDRFNRNRAEEEDSSPRRGGSAGRQRTGRREAPVEESRYQRSEKPSFPKKKFGDRSGRNRSDAPAEESRFQRSGKPSFPKRKFEDRGGRNRPAVNDRPRTERRDAPAEESRFHKTARPSFNKAERKDDRFAKPRVRHFKKKEFSKSASSSAAAPVKTFAARQGVLLWGLHAVREAWLNSDRQCFNIWGTKAGLAAIEPAIAKAQTEKFSRPTPVLTERLELEELLPSGSVHQGVVLEVAPLPDVQLYDVLQTSPLPDLIVVLDQVTDPHNVGAILRSAAAFGAGALVMTERNAPVTTGVTAKTASGAAEHVPQIHVVNLSRAIVELQQAGYWCVGLAEEATRDISTLDLSGKTAIVLGAEGDGLRRLTRESCDELARLPTGGPIGSLNVSNAAAVALYEARRQKTKFE
jgi:23S rRNA (guanosine2251-2'-O)-methyltransferase